MRRLWWIILLPSLAFSQLTGYGGIWIPSRIVGLTPSLSVAQFGTWPSEKTAQVVLSVNYYTIIDSIPAASFVYTRGVGAYYSPDTSGADTSCLYLDAFIEQNVQVNAFFLGTSADSVFITVEQALSYSPDAIDSATSSGEIFNRAFVVTDTLFQDVAAASATWYGDTMMVVVTTSGSGDYEKHIQDHFTVIAPAIRLKVHNKGPVSVLYNDIHLELYCRHPADIMSGLGGRYNQIVQNPR